ncbi:MAG TPA: DUF1775 domain-containing protein [Solirubrobacterales bacterium]|nr:YcnI family protein [Solirubrobacterales bacterium]HMU26805.1 DUF1775 domain-containing protein [Solirubrobacterales bacterium]HMW44335.1 DUF1775 domain-containing protein [Solirubrobacterales bacterium]HMX70195.1 DUF1775 domain-containing protein [Solirubrobacterales bacterium]HMY25741.1 DUF1775 domain-containing protein [Solirubrobacterales bacterium]
MSRRVSSFIACALIGGSALVLAVPAAAHIQVEPTEVAPGDAALFTLLVPGESAAGTSEVKLKVPPGVYPFSYEETPGWKRKLVKKPNGMVDQVIWTGTAAPDGLVRFSFLAGTPEKLGEIKWAAIQNYANGEESRWIGMPESENPAPVTIVSDSVPRQNAGGESEVAHEHASPTSSENATTDSETDWPITIAALLGFFFGLSSLVILLVNRINS